MVHALVQFSSYHHRYEWKGSYVAIIGKVTGRIQFNDLTTTAYTELEHVQS